VTKAQDLQAKADHFADRAAHARERTARNTYLSLEQSYRSLAAQLDRFEAAGRELSAGVSPDGAAKTG
jgi:hypothetical protein